MMRTVVVGAAVLIAAPVSAQTAGERPPSIRVQGTGVVEVPPDLASMNYTVSGEGKSPDDATRMLVTKQAAIRDGLTALLGAGAELTSSSVSIEQARDPRCGASASPMSIDLGETRLSEGNCAVTGYVATIKGRARTGVIDRIGTAVGLAGRLGASEAAIEEFELTDPVSAKKRALAAAIADARGQAAAMAAGAGVKLGELIELTDQDSRDNASDIVVTGMAAQAPAAPMQPAPATIDVKPRPIETRAVVYARYAIAR